ncbi:Uma2 family endonuclease [Methylobacter sp. BlB1]|uniref:Uma2 family endonuclease n=1 Tax=Methylobacter sp. BlB1 TaxID=2785914 RepID=UPI0018948E40|nr:Uma2 family endonuclease [Methylobacter sp. BlB1]MBF6649761.1 Uma2 family endonuclease [Methylobacter sp. BlB1]
MTYQDEAENRLTEEAYLKTEPASDIRREYIDGRAYPMADSTRNHARITGNVARHFGIHLEGTPCEAFAVGLRVRVGPDYFYPDVLVDCDSLSGEDAFSTNPVLIVEVLSRASRRLDTTTKLVRYRNLPSLQEYVLIETDFISVHVLRRSNDWRSAYYYLDDEALFESIGLMLPVEKIYERVDNEELREFRCRRRPSAGQ